MAYEIALAKAWLELERLTQQRMHQIKFLADEYTIDLENKIILSLSCNTPAEDHVSVLILHYLIQKLKGLPRVEGEWVSFRQLDGGLGYYPVFKKRVISPIKRKYGMNPQALLNLTERFQAKRVKLADVGIVIEAFEGIPILIEIWKADEEFEPEANLLFDRSISNIFPTEDTVVLSEFIAHSI